METLVAAVRLLPTVLPPPGAAKADLAAVNAGGGASPREKGFFDTLAAEVDVLDGEVELEGAPFWMKKELEAATASGLDAAGQRGDSRPAAFIFINSSRLLVLWSGDEGRCTLVRGMTTRSSLFGLGFFTTPSSICCCSTGAAAGALLRMKGFLILVAVGGACVSSDGQEPDEDEANFGSPPSVVANMISSDEGKFASPPAQQRPSGASLYML